MIVFLTLLYFGVSSCTARPNTDIGTHNVISVPPNCPDGQQLVNGECREVWRYVTAGPANIITVPTNCPPGQQYINGQCRDVWLRNGNELYDVGQFAEELDVESKNVISTPSNCNPGQVFINGQCRDVWRMNDNSRNIITVPPNCPPGQQLVNGQCRDIWRSSSNDDLGNILTRRENQLDNANSLATNVGFDIQNIISVPNQCPAGYRPDALGNCRPIM